MTEDITPRLIAAIDSLPLPAARTPDLDRRARSRASVLLVTAIAVALVLASIPGARDAAAQAIDRVRSLFVPVAWSGYYVQPEAIAMPSGTLRYVGADGTDRAVLSSADIGAPAWSWDRTRVAIVSEGAVYVGDDRGRVTKLTGPVSGVTFRSVSWTRDGRQLLAIGQGPVDRSIVRIDPRTGAAERRELPALPRSGLFSPDGSWLLGSDAQGNPFGGRLYELSTGRIVNAETTTAFLGFLSDGRVLTVHSAGSAWLVFDAREPGAPIGTELARFDIRGVAGAWVDPRVPVLIVGQRASGDEPMELSILPADRPASDPIARVTLAPDVTVGAISADGAYASVIQVRASPGAGTYDVLRSGVLDLRTGAVRWVCQSGCWGLALR